jgi:hypothetical protein
MMVESTEENGVRVRQMAKALNFLLMVNFIIVDYGLMMNLLFSHNHLSNVFGEFESD